MRKGLFATFGLSGPSAFLFLSFSTLALTALFVFRHFLQDDAYISMRYAANLLSGNGLVWNPGERVEGYTNFLFVISLTILGKFGMDLVLAARALGVLSYFGVVCVILKILRKETPEGVLRAHGDGPLLLLVPLGVVLVSLPLAAWSLAGMETMPFALLTTTSFAAAAGLLSSGGTPGVLRSLGAGLLFALSTLMRPEGGIFFVATFICLMLPVLRKAERTKVKDMVHLFIFGTAYSSVVLPYLAWKNVYYGSLLPNTFYAKVYGLDPLFRLGKGLEYTLSFIFHPPALTICAALLLGHVMIVKREGISRRLGYLLLMAFVILCYVTAVGGDFMPYFRFYVPLVPLLALIIHELLLGMAEGGHWKAIRVGAFLTLVLTALPFLYVAPRPQSAAAVTAEVIAPYIRQHWPGDSLVAVNVAGALPYLAGEYRYIDMLGMTDPHIARSRVENPRLSIGHLKGDGDYVLMRRPDYILFAFPYGSDVPLPVYRTGRELYGSPLFQRDYRREAVWIDIAPDLQNKLAVVARRHPQVRVRNGRMLFVYHRRNDANS